MLRFLFTALLLLVLCMSCNTAIVKTAYKSIEGASWNKDDILNFKFSVQDTLQEHQVFINIRNDESFAYSNLFIIAKLSYPNGDVEQDTLEYQMAMPDGTWLGKGQGSLKENKLWYKENIVFSSSGVYTLDISHAMRKNGSISGVIGLEGITDVGYQIEKNK